MFQNSESLYTYFERVGAAAPNIPLLTYIFGGPTDAAALMRQLMEIPTVAGAKYTGPNMYEFQRNCENCEGITGAFFLVWMNSVSTPLCRAHAATSVRRSIISPGSIVRSTAVTGKAISQLEGNTYKFAPIEVTRVLFSFGFFGALKEVMRMLGFDCGKPRLPQLPFAAEKQDELRAELEAIDFFTVAEM